MAPCTCARSYRSIIIPHYHNNVKQAVRSMTLNSVATFKAFWNGRGLNACHLNDGYFGFHNLLGRDDIQRRTSCDPPHHLSGQIEYLRFNFCTFSNRTSMIELTRGILEKKKWNNPQSSSRQRINILFKVNVN